MLDQMTFVCVGEDVQIEDGHYFPIHNAIMETLAVARFTATEFRALMFLLRKTYGYQKKEDAISLTQWAEGTNSDKGQIANVLAGLVRKQVIYCKLSDHARKGHTWGFNKYFEQWDAALFERMEAKKRAVPPDSPAPKEPDLGASGPPAATETHPKNGPEPPAPHVEQPLKEERSLSNNSTIFEQQLNDSLSNNSTTKDNTKDTKTKDKESAGRSRPPAKRGGKSQKPEIPEGVKFYHEVMGRYPPKVLYAKVDAAVQVRRDAEFMRECFAEWIARNYQPGNLAGWLFDWYVDGVIPPRKGGNHGRQGQSHGLGARKDPDDPAISAYTDEDYARLAAEWDAQHASA